jgi:MFS family permease
MTTNGPSSVTIERCSSSRQLHHPSVRICKDGVPLHPVGWLRRLYWAPRRCAVNGGPAHRQRCPGRRDLAGRSSRVPVPSSRLGGGLTRTATAVAVSSVLRRSMYNRIQRPDDDGLVPGRDNETVSSTPSATVPTIKNSTRGHDHSVVQKIAVMLVIVAASLAVGSVLHLTGLVHGRSNAFDPDDAGIAEAAIAAVLAAGSIAMFRTPRRAHAVGLATIGFAIVGFVIGLTETTRGGHLPDIAYHSVVLPILIASLVALLRPSRDSPAPPG